MKNRYYNNTNYNNNNMSLKITLPLLISLIGVNSLANYTIVYPVKFVNFINVVAGSTFF